MLRALRNADPMNILTFLVLAPIALIGGLGAISLLLVVGIEHWHAGWVPFSAYVFSVVWSVLAAVWFVFGQKG